MTSKSAVESMLEFWGRFYVAYDFGGLGYPHKAIIKPEIKSTKPHEDIKIPGSVEIIDIAILQLTPRQKQVINSEYLKQGHYKKKAENLEMSHACYRATLNHAKCNLIQILDTA
ncbi:MAG: hypothetical protein GY694_15415 [Gammaproteobacteria bacterium]|nr:hypothetical protein [Gammaproteobacteria bacterium]